MKEIIDNKVHQELGDFLWDEVSKERRKQIYDEVGLQVHQAIDSRLRAKLHFRYRH